MRERALIALIAVPLTVVLIYIGAVILQALPPTHAARYTFVGLWSLLVIAEVTWALTHAFRGRNERIGRGTEQGPKHRAAAAARSNRS